MNVIQLKLKLPTHGWNSNLIHLFEFSSNSWRNVTLYIYQCLNIQRFVIIFWFHFARVPKKQKKTAQVDMFTDGHREINWSSWRKWSWTDEHLFCVLNYTVLVSIGNQPQKHQCTICKKTLGIRIPETKANTHSEDSHSKHLQLQILMTFPWPSK